MIRHLKLIVLSVFIFCISGAFTEEELTAAKKADIRKYLKLSGAGEIGMQVLASMIDSFKKSMPNVEEKFWADFLKKANADEFVELIVPSYDKHFTHDEIKELIKFQESPAGRKLAKVQPSIVAECGEAGGKWGARLADEVFKELDKQKEVSDPNEKKEK